KIRDVLVLLRHWIDMPLQLDLCFCAARSACKNSSGLTSYFIERKAKYSPIERLCLVRLHCST
ncbi:MAG: hypothetical protein QXD70_01610, partial [Candidatus Bathyarchaeia archaeon]